MRVCYTATALCEVVEILTYIATDNPESAVRVSAEIERTVDRICRYPRSATRSDEGKTRVARVGRYPYLIFYDVDADEVVILQVRHGAPQRR